MISGGDSGGGAGMGGADGCQQAAAAVDVFFGVATRVLDNGLAAGIHIQGGG